MDDLTELLHTVADEAGRFRAGLPERPVAPRADLAGVLPAFEGPLPDHGVPAGQVIADLIGAGPGLMGSAGPRFFGFVVGGALPAATAADMLATGWDQAAFNAVLSPAAAAAERVAGGWLKDLLGIPAGASVGFVTGAQGGNTVGLAAARQHVLAAAGWDVGARGLTGAPRVRVLAGQERHATIDASLRLLGFGTDGIEAVPADRHGAMDMAALATILAADPADTPLIVCLQAGNVNTGAFDDLRAGAELAHARGGWVHVDGAFGLWAGASPRLRQLVDGVELADSWCADGHKWLNVPYDSGFAFCSRPAAQATAMSYSASYLSGSEAISYGPGDLVPESSRRARGFAVWAALRELGRDGVADLVERCCALARRFADSLTEGGATVVNEVVLNQVLVDVEHPGAADPARVDRIIDAVQREGTCWLGGTTWRGRRLIRVSVSNYATTEADVDASVAAVLRVINGTA
ncbi:pyridoxal phosphate-dependent decarboxylase family protein [Nakamurella lactea]|uniref:pyridoxal phosphate-dependent decarboxylase family protein n=1 Tax=Nakamurella lactea TaxID=459515 RepID=UPI0003FD4967|nr:pyridoxal-dependent decarboxylase [Nakamurella lactea]